METQICIQMFEAMQNMYDDDMLGSALASLSVVRETIS
jgi:hypothetical protein